MRCSSRSFGRITALCDSRAAVASVGGCQGALAESCRGYEQNERVTAALSCPIAVVVGARDRARERMRPHGWARYTSELDVTELLCGHLPMQELPERCANVIVELSG